MWFPAEWRREEAKCLIMCMRFNAAFVKLPFSIFIMECQAFFWLRGKLAAATGCSYVATDLIDAKNLS
jgi:hypothetical protein